MIPTPSAQVVKVLAAAVRRASRMELGFVGTEHWTGVDDSGVLAESVPDVMALLRAAHHHARVETVLPVSRALDECLRAAIAEAGDGVLTTAHLSLPGVRKAAAPEEAPAVWLLRKAGALEGESGGGYVRWLTKLIVRGGRLGGPVLPVVRNEAERLAVAAGRPEATAADLVAAVLTIDHQLTVAGRRLRPELESGGAAALRAAGVDPATLPAASGAGVERFVEGAKLVAARRGDDVVGTAHLVVALRDDLLDPVGRALRGLAVET